MPKIYNRARNGGEQATALGRSLLSLQSSSDAWVKAVTTGIFNHLKLSLSHRIIFEAGRNARLSPYDEKIFDYYKQIIECYERILLLYKENQDNLTAYERGWNVKKILEGICAVLASQVRQFEDTAKNAGGNPISVEKREIISEGLGIFIKEYDANCRAYHEVNYRDSLQKSRQFLFDGFTMKEALELFGGIAGDISGFSEERLRKAYIAGLTHCVEGLNNDARRDTTFFYYELLVKEEEFLSGIVKIQVAALESVMEKELAEPKIKEFVFLVLTNMREGYQRLRGQLREIADGWREFKGDEGFCAESVDKEEEFAAVLKEILQGERIFSIPVFEEYRDKWVERKTSFTDKLRAELDFRIKKELRPYSLGRTVYELQKIIAEQLLMAQELCRCYEEIITFFNFNKEDLNLSAHWDIISGIHETLEIKIESITENKHLFNKEGQRLIEEYKEERKKPSYEPLMEVVFSFLRQNTGSVEQAVEAAMGGAEMNAIIEQAGKTHGNIKEIFLKSAGRFKREHLLYELSTFEEIIIYSVSRLREPKEEDVLEAKKAVAAYVKLIDRSSDQMEIILKKHNIYLIRPAPHEMFNAKEHEVLMAEQNKEFQKGEIIKLMNSGYKQEDRVLLRANVIAAR